MSLSASSYFRHAALSNFVNFAIASVRNATNNLYDTIAKYFPGVAKC